VPDVKFIFSWLRGVNELPKESTIEDIVRATKSLLPPTALWKLAATIKAFPGVGVALRLKGRD